MSSNPSYILSVLPAIDRYPIALRLLHWIRALLIFGLIAAGWLMTSLNDATPIKYATLYPLHKSVGLLVFALVLTQLVLRVCSPLPETPVGLKVWERRFSKAVHVLMYVLLIIVPLMGYAMSSSYTMSDGVTFFGLHVPELLPKDDGRFKVFQAVHKIAAYLLLALIGLHVAGAVKHRMFDKRGNTDVLARML